MKHSIAFLLFVAWLGCAGSVETTETDPPAPAVSSAPALVPTVYSENPNAPPSSTASSPPPILPPCASACCADADCDDKNDCTEDVCWKSKCFHWNYTNLQRCGAGLAGHCEGNAQPGACCMGCLTFDAGCVALCPGGQKCGSDGFCVLDP